MDPSPENNRAAWYQGPMKLEVVKSSGATPTGGHCLVTKLKGINSRLKEHFKNKDICQNLTRNIIFPNL